MHLHPVGTGLQLLLQPFRVGLAVEYLSCFISLLSLCYFDSLISRSPSRGPKNVYVYKPQQNLGRGLL